MKWEWESLTDGKRDQVMSMGFWAAPDCDRDPPQLHFTEVMNMLVLKPRACFTIQSK